MKRFAEYLTEASDRNGPALEGISHHEAEMNHHRSEYEKESKMVREKGLPAADAQQHANLVHYHHAMSEHHRSGRRPPAQLPCSPQKN